jgi:putative transcriptional regulator
MTLMPLIGELLVATPALNQTIYARSVIFLCEHHEQGSVGLMINRPTSFFLSYIFEQLNIESDQSTSKKLPLLFGGPIQPERGFVLHSPKGQWRSSLVLKQQDVTLTTSNDIIRAFGDNSGPKDAIIALGYSAWESKQLEEEIIKNYWLVCPFKKEILYETPYAERWSNAGHMLGVNIEDFTFGEGNA